MHRSDSSGFRTWQCYLFLFSPSSAQTFTDFLLLISAFLGKLSGNSLLSESPSINSKQMITFNFPH